MVKVITDSVSDIPDDVAKELDITIVPVLVNFGSESYRDRVDLSIAEFYQKLETSPVFPKTSAPSPGVFAEFYDKISEKSGEILGIFLSRKLSATYDVAAAGIGLMKNKCKIEIMDSTSAIMGQGLVVIEAAKKAVEGVNLEELAEYVKSRIPKVHMRAILPTLKYLYKGGRIGKVESLLGSMLNINPVLGIKDGIAFPFGKTRSRCKAIAKMYDYITSVGKIKALAVEYGSNAAEGLELAKRLAAEFPGTPLYISNVSPVIGTHTGPEVLSISAIEY
jgi:DegV family protein with EDD domain